MTRGTLKSAVKSAVAGIRAHLRSRAHKRVARHFKRADFEVVILTQSNRRLATLRQVARRVVPNERHGWYTLATFEALAPAGFEWWQWQDLDGDEVTGVLHDR